MENRANLWKPSKSPFGGPAATLVGATSSQQFRLPCRNSLGKMASVENFNELMTVLETDLADPAEIRD